MPRGRPLTHLSKRDVQLMIRKEIERALSQLEVRATLIGTKPKGRPIGTATKRKRA
jgi:hypothetical protein